jgi:HB1, ASXL, restriction endonuclease HTH domain
MEDAMAEETTSGDPYDIVLADLKVKRAQLDQAIAAIEAVKSGISQSSQMIVQAPISTPSGEITPGMFHGMSIVEAVKQLLAMRKKPLGTQDITEAIISGGVVFSTDTPANTVGSVLHRESNKATGAGIVSVSRGTWALPGWYPNPGRFQKKKAAEAPTDDLSDISGTEEKSD